MYDLQQAADLVITCARGAAPFLQGELSELGYPSKALDDTALEVRGRWADVLRLNLHLRSAQRILLPLATCTASTPDQLHAALVREPWENLLHADGYFTVTTSIDTPSIRDPRFAGLRCKDAVVDRMNQACGRRPDTGGERSGAVLHLRWHEQKATVFLDTSGEPLSRRGYRRIPLKAPMQETLAATCILASPWRGASAFVNPMCGSGTLAIEAALVAINRAPGLLRRHFSFQSVKGFREESWKDLKRTAQAEERAAPAAPIFASDLSEEAVDAARQNARNAGVDRFIEFSVGDYAATVLPPPPGVIVFNPEYGERMGDESRLEPVYRGIGDFLKQKANGYMAYVFTANLKLAKCVGLHARRRIILYNANLEARLLEFEMYTGTRDP